MEKLKRYNIVAPDTGEEWGWDLEMDKDGDMVYYDDVKDLEERIEYLESEVQSLYDEAAGAAL